MKKRILIIALFCMGAFGLSADENARQQDLTIILQKTWLAPQMDALIDMVAEKLAAERGKQIDTSDIVQKFRAFFENGSAWNDFYPPYAVFTDEEIHAIREIHENPVYGKYVLHGGKALQENMAVLSGIIKTLVEQTPPRPATEEKAPELLEITEANFETEVLESKIPVVIDFYSHACPPCKSMEEILKDMGVQYKDAVRFVKIDCGTQFELAKKFKVTQLPTFLFMRPKEETPALQVKGFTPKKAFQAKIDEFLEQTKSQ